MKRWGLIITLVYALLVLLLLAPGARVLAGDPIRSLNDFKGAYRDFGWSVPAFVILGEIVLIGLRVDTTRRRLKPRARVAISAITTGFFLAMLSVFALLSIILAAPDILATDAPTSERSSLWGLIVWLVPWLIWGLLFYRLYRKAEDPVTHAVSWLLRGSVLELLVAVPSHVIVRRRGDCCAPAATGLGIMSGIAIMFLAFGPSVLLLYKQRMERYSPKELTLK